MMAGWRVDQPGKEPTWHGNDAGAAMQDERDRILRGVPSAVAWFDCWSYDDEAAAEDEHLAERAQARAALVAAKGNEEEGL